MIFSPFTLNGPDFLTFYFVLGLCVCIGIYVSRLIFENGKIEKIPLNDSYLISYLRGWEYETLRLATISLIGKNLLRVNGTKLEKKNINSNSDMLEIQLESSVLDFFETEKEAYKLFESESIKSQCEPYKVKLEAFGLIPDEFTKLIRYFLLAISLFLTVGVSGYRITMSILNGKYNIIFLIALTILFLIPIIWFMFRKRTLKGDRLLKNLKSLVAAQKNPSSKSKGFSDELLFSTAVLGITAVTPLYPFVQELYPKAYNNSSSSSSSSCGSSCSSGSSCGSGCGGGCGGGD